MTQTELRPWADRINEAAKDLAAWKASNLGDAGIRDYAHGLAEAVIEDLRTEAMADGQDWSQIAATLVREMLADRLAVDLLDLDMFDSADERTYTVIARAAEDLFAGLVVQQRVDLALHALTVDAIVADRGARVAKVHATRNAAWAGAL